MKNFKRSAIILLTLLVGIAFNSSAQQVPQFSQLLQSRHMLNPAATGEKEQHDIFSGFRKQWLGIDQSPTSYYLGYNKGLVKITEAERFPLAIRTARTNDYQSYDGKSTKGKIKHGVGGYIIGDNYGAFKNMSLNLNYALHAALNEKITGSIGVSTRFHNSRFDQSLAQVENLNDNTYSNFVAQRNGLTSLEFDFGAYIYHEKWFVGYSTNQLTGDAISFGNVSGRILELHHTLMGGYTMEVNDKIDFKPTTIIRAVGGAPITLDLLANFNINTTFEAGLGYRNQDALMILLGYNYDSKYRIGYSYDLGIGVLSNTSTGSHEITFGAIF